LFGCGVGAIFTELTDGERWDIALVVVQLTSIAALFINRLQETLPTSAAPQQGVLRAVVRCS